MAVLQHSTPLSNRADLCLHINSNNITSNPQHWSRYLFYCRANGEPRSDNWAQLSWVVSTASGAAQPCRLFYETVIVWPRMSLRRKSEKLWGGGHFSPLYLPLPPPHTSHLSHQPRSQIARDIWGRRGNIANGSLSARGESRQAVSCERSVNWPSCCPADGKNKLLQAFSGSQSVHCLSSKDREKYSGSSRLCLCDGTGCRLVGGGGGITHMTVTNNSYAHNNTGNWFPKNPGTVCVTWQLDWRGGFNPLDVKYDDDDDATAMIMTGDWWLVII